MSKNDDNNDGGKNPWGKSGDNTPVQGPWGGSGGSHNQGNPQGPDIDDVLRFAKDNIHGVLPGGGSIKLFLLGIVILLALWASSGFYIVEPGEHAVIQLFGAHNRTKTEEGLGYHMPWPIETVSTVNVSKLRRLEIGFVDVSGRRGQTSVSKRDIPDESLMLTSDANIVNLDLVVLWNISSAPDFLFNIDDPENTIKKVVESAIREVVGQTPMFPIITKERTQVAQRARKIMMENLEQYKSGVNISQVLIQEAEVHPDVQGAFQDVQSAKQDAIDVQNRAQAYREDILPKARGTAIQTVQQAQAYKQSVIARATGDAERFNSIYQSYLSGKEVTRKRMYIETMEDVFKNAQKIIMDDNGSGVVPYLPLTEMKSGEK